ncbi:cell wall-binding repeat-containing protein [Marinilactibacillus psychrotolerans]|uniref:cell wall-binding repeat-containing protein n=1 Tax=Marinilactibacillus psychrotolerans TaxID=191770 RepID=UPI003886ED99
MRSNSFRKSSRVIFITALALGLFSQFQTEVFAEVSSGVVSRIQGETRFETATKITQESYDQADTVFIASAREFADALTGVLLAYQQQSPILLAQGKK